MRTIIIVLFLALPFKLFSQTSSMGFWGNVIETTIHVENLENQPTDENQTQNNVNTNTTLENTNAHVDNTVASKVLPATGITTIIKVLIAIVLVGMIVFYIKYKNLKDLIK